MEPNERMEYLAGCDTAHGGDCLTPADLEEQDERDALVRSVRIKLAEHRERKAYKLVQDLEKTLDRAVAHWNRCQTEMFAAREPN